MAIEYLQSPVGIVQIVATDAWVSSILFKDTMDEQPAAEPNVMTQLAAAQLAAYFSGKPDPFTFPMYQSGTAFQQKVWDVLLNIPLGKTCSYLELARILGDEKCIRAAASSNGKNKLAIVVPCHRVIGQSGKLVGYAGGLWRKQWLLEHEKKMTGKHVQASLNFSS